MLAFNNNLETLKIVTPLADKPGVNGSEGNSIEFFICSSSTWC